MPSTIARDDRTGLRARRSGFRCATPGREAPGERGSRRSRAWHLEARKLTQNAGSAVMDSQNISVEQGHQQIEPEHLAAALLKQKEGLIPKLISGMGKDVKNIITEIDKEIAKFPKVQGAGNVYLSSKLNHVFMQAEKMPSSLKMTL